MNYLKLLIKGFIMGIANIIPGVSGGTLAITLNIYEDIISAISHFFKNIKKNLLFVIPIGIGGVLAVILGSRLIEMCLNKFTLPTILFFTGLILGGIPMLFKKIKHKVKLPYILIFLITFAIVIGITFLKSSGDVSFETMNILSYIKLFIVGVIAAATMIIPGISGSFMLMTMGYYKPILGVINEFTSLTNVGSNFMILMPFGLGVLVGIIAIAKVIEYLFKKFEVPTYYGIIGFVLASLIGIFVSSKTDIVFTVPFVIIGLILLGIGFIIANKLGDE